MKLVSPSAKELETLRFGGFRQATLVECVDFVEDGCQQSVLVPPTFAIISFRSLAPCAKTIA